MSHHIHIRCEACWVWPSSLSASDPATWLAMPCQEGSRAEDPSFASPSPHGSMVAWLNTTHCVPIQLCKSCFGMIVRALTMKVWVLTSTLLSIICSAYCINMLTSSWSLNSELKIIFVKPAPVYLENSFTLDIWFYAWSSPYQLLWLLHHMFRLNAGVVLSPCSCHFLTNDHSQCAWMRRRWCFGDIGWRRLVRLLWCRWRMREDILAFTSSSGCSCSSEKAAQQIPSASYMVSHSGSSMGNVWYPSFVGRRVSGPTL